MTSRAHLALFLILLATAAVYAPVARFEFVHYDDPVYVFQNEMVRGGLTAEGLHWAFTTGAESNWHPLTWLSHMADAQFLGPDAAGAHHLVNLALHLLNIGLVWLVVGRLTGRAGPSLFVTAAFALHPLHVESVAWVSERKDLLSTTWWMLSLLTYERFARTGRRRLWGATLAFLAAGLLTKPMLVTAPFLFLLLDAWPLGRLRRDTLTTCLVEKLPMLALVIASSTVTWLVQDQGGAMATMPWGHRLANAAVSYIRYLGKMAWPANLAPLYPNHLGMWAAWQVGASLGFLAGLSGLVWRRGSAAVRVGWLWYLGTLFPVIGVVQVGRQSLADRYTYVPMIGLTLALAMGVDQLARHRPNARRVVATLATLLVLVWVPLTFQQVGIWRDTPTLFRAALARTVDNDVMENNYGSALLERGQTAAAIPYFQRSLAIRPDVSAHRNLARALLSQGRPVEATQHFEAALRLGPGDAQTHNDLGRALRSQGRTRDAIAQYQIALRLDPDLAVAWNNLGSAMGSEGNLEEAVRALRRAVQLRPDYAVAHQNLGLALRSAGQTTEAAVHLRRALELDPSLSQAQELLESLGGS